MGVFDSAGLGYQGVGLVLIGAPEDGDAIMPGCLCEGWGTAANGVDGFWSYGVDGTAGMVSSSFTSTGTDTSYSTVLFSNGLSVLHSYSSAADGNLFKIEVSMTNTSAGDMSDVRYARTLDWDVPPGHFEDDLTTIYGGSRENLPACLLLASLLNFTLPGEFSNLNH